MYKTLGYKRLAYKVLAAAMIFAGSLAALAQATGPNARGSNVTPVPPDVVKELAPTGKLRAALNLGNGVLVQGPPQDPRGVTVDLSRELGKRLGVPVEFTAPYVLIEGTYMVLKDSPLKVVADVDRPGVRIAVGVGSAYDLFLTRNLKNATLVRAKTGGGRAMIDLFLDEKLEAAAGVKQPLVEYAKTDPRVRVMDGRFQVIEQAMGTPKGRSAAAKYLRAFVEEMKASGFVADALKRSNQPDAEVAPPA